MRTCGRAWDAAEERLRALAPAAEVGIWVWPDLSARRVYLDAAMRRIHGLDVDREWFDPEEVFAKIHPDDIAQVRATIAEIVAAGGPYVVEYRHLRDGTMATVDYARTFGEATLHEGRAPSLRGTTVLVNAEYRLTRERDRAYEALQRAVAAGAVQLWDWPSMSGGDVTPQRGPPQRRPPGSRTSLTGPPGTRGSTPTTAKPSPPPWPPCRMPRVPSRSRSA